MSNTSNQITAVPQLDVNNFPVNEPPSLPINIIVFPSRDFISPSGFLPDDVVTVQVIRRVSNTGGIIVSSATGIIPTPDGFAEVNHPGGACWEGVTPEIRAGDLVRTIAYNPANIGPGNPDGIPLHRPDPCRRRHRLPPVVVANDNPNTAENEGIVEIHGTALGADGQPLPIDQIEQRMVANRDHFDFNGRRTMRAAAGSDGTLTYDTAGNAMGVNWTARYEGLDATTSPAWPAAPACRPDGSSPAPTPASTGSAHSRCCSPRRRSSRTPMATHQGPPAPVAPGRSRPPTSPRPPPPVASKPHRQVPSK
jgi:hypothetical protein